MTSRESGALFTLVDCDDDWLLVCAGCSTGFEISSVGWLNLSVVNRALDHACDGDRGS